MAITKIGSMLQDHQQRVGDRLSGDDLAGLIAYHAMGSGKTLTALRAAERQLANDPEGRALFITPASLQENILKERLKHRINIPEDRMVIRSYEKAVRDADALEQDHFAFVAMDEAHKLRNSSTKRVQTLRKVLGKADKKLLMTGTAAYNHPMDIVSLTNLIDPEVKVPKTQTEFENLYVDKKTGKLTPQGRRFLEKNVAPYVDAYTPAGDSEFQQSFPRVRSTTIPVVMSDKQQVVYKFLENKLPPKLRRAVRQNLPLSLKESNDLNAFATGVRQASTGHYPFSTLSDIGESAKLEKAVESMYEASQARPGFRGVAYSNFLKAGIDPYTRLLRKKGIEPQVLTGSMTRKEKDQAVKDFNALSDDAKVLLLSSSGGEGLDLKGVRKLQILEPHFNQAKIDQVKARAVRYLSHAHLPEDQRDVEIEEYHSTFKPTRWQRLWRKPAPTTIDRYLSDHSKRKQTTIDEVKQVLSQYEAKN